MTPHQAPDFKCDASSTADLVNNRNSERVWMKAVPAEPPFDIMTTVWQEKKKKKVEPACMQTQTQVYMEPNISIQTSLDPIWMKMLHINSSIRRNRPKGNGVVEYSFSQLINSHIMSYKQWNWMLFGCVLSVHSPSWRKCVVKFHNSKHNMQKWSTRVGFSYRLSKNQTLQKTKNS